LAACDPGSVFDEPAETTSSLGSQRLQRDPATIIVGRPTDAIYLDPARPSDNESVEVVEQVYDKLLTYEPGSNTVVPALATRWEVSQAGRVWTFELRRDVTFHDGSRLDADAVVFSLERQRDPDHPFHRPGWFSYWENGYRNVLKVEKVDDFTVRITIERSYAPFEANLAMFPVAIVSPAALRRWGDDFKDHPVGTGPFAFGSWTRQRDPVEGKCTVTDHDPAGVPSAETLTCGGEGEICCETYTPDDAAVSCTPINACPQRIVLERNPDYWTDPAKVDRVVFQVMPDARDRLVALESGAADIAYGILPEELQYVQLHPALVLHKVAANNVAYLAMNTGGGQPDGVRPPFDDHRVRQAVNYAINKEPIVKLVYQGSALPADGPVPPEQWGYHKPQLTYGYDPAKARQLLAAAQADGHFDPDRVYTLYVPSTPRPYLPAPERIARVLQANLLEVGIKTRLEAHEFKAHLAAVESGVHDLCLHGWVGDNGDPDNFLYTLLDRDNTVPGLARNVAFFADPYVHGLLVQAQESDSRQERERLYADAQEIIAAEAPWVPLAHTQVMVAARADVGGLIINPQSQVYYRLIERIHR
ncbi:MAG TPA: ABC transporter substrate-binding protein, partial [Kofleriaceae bacterium]|nr:ABC transporter substrate-binding protein [Kofleriaceae bacterium]